MRAASRGKKYEKTIVKIRKIHSKLWNQPGPKNLFLLLLQNNDPNQVIFESFNIQTTACGWDKFFNELFYVKKFEVIKQGKPLFTVNQILMRLTKLHIFFL